MRLLRIQTRIYNKLSNDSTSYAKKKENVFIILFVKKEFMPNDSHNRGALLHISVFLNTSITSIRSICEATKIFISVKGLTIKKWKEI